MWRPDRAVAGRRLARECEAFLDGRYADLLISRGRDVPVWSWTNALAHGSEDRLRELVTADWRRRTYSLRVWTKASSYLAGELLEAGGRCGLARIQAEVLVPLESDLASSSDARRWQPWEWVGLVMTALRGSETSHGTQEVA